MVRVTGHPLVRIVLDTNIYIVGLGWPDDSEGQILRLLSHRPDVTVLLSTELEDQIRRVGRRVGGKDWAGWVLNRIWYDLNVEFVVLPDQPFELAQHRAAGIPREDVLIFLAALLGGADYLVSNNREFLKRSKSVQSEFRCLTPTEFLEQYSAH